MPSVRFRREDFQGKVPMVPGWYLLDIGDFEERTAKGGDSTNFWGAFTVATEGQFKGTEISHCFSEKALQYSGGAAEFIACFTDDSEQFVDAEVIDALKKTTGRQVMGSIVWNPEFRRNNVKEWRPAK